MLGAHPVWILAFVTLGLVLAALVWQRSSVRHSQRKRGETPGEVALTPPEQRPGTRP